MITWAVRKVEIFSCMLFGKCCNQNRANSEHFISCTNPLNSQAENGIGLEIQLENKVWSMDLACWLHKPTWWHGFGWAEPGAWRQTLEELEIWSIWRKQSTDVLCMYAKVVSLPKSLPDSWFISESKMPLCKWWDMESANRLMRWSCGVQQGKR